MGLSEHIAKVLTLDPKAIAVESETDTASWGDLDAASAHIAELLEQAGVAADAPVGWAARNNIAAVVGFIAIVRSGRMVVPLRPNFGAGTFRDDILAQKLSAVIGGAEDWAADGVMAAAKKVGSMGIEVADAKPFAADLCKGLEKPGKGPHRDPMPDYVLERLTSGTTGAPKRIPVKREVLIPSLEAGMQDKDRKAALKLKRSPALLFKPFSHAGGLFGLLLTLYQARPMVLFERFQVERWVAAVDRWKPGAASLVPAMIRMILDADIAPERLASLKAIRSGTAPIEPEVQEAFEARFGIPILVDYGAAEFIGGLAGWTLGDYKKFGKEKRGSVGRARGDVAIRTVDAESGKPTKPGAIGIVEVKSDRYGPDWIGTNDLAEIDADGFIYLRGRADDAINRGGFKILPDDVAAILRRHPAIKDAAIVGQKDDRLGQVPIAALELNEGAQQPADDELSGLIRENMPSYAIPVAYHLIDPLPRTVSMKVARETLKEILGV